MLRAPRNLFDQYNHPENRLTHALISSLASDPILLNKFIRWITGEKPPSSRLEVVEQSRPGEEEPHGEDEAGRKGLPDGWIYDTDGWCLIIESKIGSPLKRDQLERHRRTAEGRGFTHVHLLALVVDPPKEGSLSGVTVTVRKWTQLYRWLMQEKQSEWAGRLASYMAVLEQKLVRDNYRREGTLTVFEGIPFGKDERPYNYSEAKRLLRLALDELRKRGDLKDELGMDFESKGRSAITGREGTTVWDFLRLAQAPGGHTEFPHLTLSIGEDQLQATVTVPNGIRRQFRMNLLSDGRDGFCALFRKLLDNLNASLKGVNGAAPWVEVFQRRYPTQGSEPIIDARIQFDLRTAFEEHKGVGSSVKQQRQWLDATYDALAQKTSNLQLGVGAIFRYDGCPDVHKAEILNCVANVWLGCKPLIETLIGDEKRRG